MRGLCRVLEFEKFEQKKHPVFIHKHKFKNYQIKFVISCKKTAATV